MSEKTLAALCTLVIAVTGFIASPGIATAASAKNLKIYFIDVEGGQSTLVVTPDRHSLLIDTGFAGDGAGFRPGDPHHARDANRIRRRRARCGNHADRLLAHHTFPP